MKTCSTIWSVLGIALGFAVPNTQARAQAPACVVVEVMAEGQEAFTQKLLPAVDKRGNSRSPGPARIGPTFVRKIAKRFGVNAATVQRISRPFDLSAAA